MINPVNELDAAVSDDQLAFRFVAGNRSLDLLSTLGDRHRQPVERLREPSDLDRWLHGAGLSISRRASQRDLEAARDMRETTNRLIRAMLARERPGTHDLRELNEWARRPSLAPQADLTLRRRWVADQSVQAALALIARGSVELLTGPDGSAIRECAAAPRCALLYLDRSRTGRRRWCQMEICGSRAKMTRYRRRRSTKSAG